MHRSVETIETIEVEYGERGPIVQPDRAIHGRRTGRYEIMKVVRTTAADGDVKIRVYGLPVRLDDERKESSMYSIVIYGDDVDLAAAEILARPPEE